MKLSAKTILLALVLSLATACVRTSSSGLEDCEYPLRLRFCYTYNREGRDLFGEEVPCVALRLYDSSGRLVRARDVKASEIGPDGSFMWSAPQGRFTLVTWGGVESRCVLDAAPALADAKLSLPDVAGRVTQAREHVWHCVTGDILVNGTLTPVYEVDMHKVSNDVCVGVSSADGMPLERTPAAQIRAANNIYDFAGQIHPSAYEVSYLPADPIQTAEGGARLDFTTLGLSRHDRSALKVEYGETTIYDGGLTELIAMQPDIIFDLDDEFFLDFEVGRAEGDNLSVGIKVNGWHVRDYDVPLR